MAANEDFKNTTAPSGEERAQRSFLYELVVRFITLRHYKYKQRLDVHDYLDEGIISVAGNPKFDWEREKEATFTPPPQPPAPTAASNYLTASAHPEWISKTHPADCNAYTDIANRFVSPLYAQTGGNASPTELGGTQT